MISPLGPDPRIIDAGWALGLTPRFVMLTFAAIAIGCSYDWTLPAGASAGADASATTGLCKSNDDCNASSFCAFGDGLCGKGTNPGKCASRTQSCATGAPVCGCSGRSYGSLCDAAQAGDDVGSASLCGAQTAAGSCGDVVCAVKAEFCVMTAKVGRCESLDGCAASCQCEKPAAYSKQACSCSVGADGLPTVTCP